MKILLVDATNNFLRNFAVVPTMDLNGEPNGGTCGMLASLNYFLKITAADRMILAWDGVGGSKRRRSVIKEYKQGRKPTRLNRNFEHELDNVYENKINQRKRLAAYLNDLPIYQVVVDDIEADDIIAYLLKYYSNDEITIASTDKDFYQLLSDKVIIYNPRLKSFVKKEDVYTQYGIHSHNLVLARAIIGDKSDNLIGVKGVGMKTLLKLLPFFSNEEKIELDFVLNYCKDCNELGVKDTKLERFLQNEELIRNNLKVMQLDTSIISFHSQNKINEFLLKPKTCFNKTFFRMKLMEDGITTISDSFFTNFKILEIKEKENNASKIC